MTDKPGPSLKRFVGGLGGFLLATSALYAGNVRVPGWQILLLLLVTFVPIFFLLLVLAARWAVKDSRHWQFQLSSLFLATICPAIYLAGLRWYLHAIGSPPETLTWKGWLFVLLANAILITFLALPVMAVGESLLWFGVWCLRFVRRRWL